MPQWRHPTCQEAAARAPPSSVKVPAASRLLDHPGTVYLREADLLPHQEGWLTGLFHPRNPRCHSRCAHRRQPGRQRHCRGLRKVERTLADCQRQLARYRAALDAGAI